MNRNCIRLSVIAILWTTFGFGQIQDSTKVTALKEVVVSDTKFAQSKEKSGKIIEVITAKELEKKSGQTIANVLSQVAGVEINGNQSPNGKNLGYYIRGGRNRQVVIYIDGIPVTDASGIGVEFDLRLLSVDQVERIEIMKGASSSLYGTGAATGVINITLKKASKEPISGNAYIHLGTQNTAETNKYSGQDANQGISLHGTLGKVSYLTSLNSSETNGISEAKGLNYEEDSFSRINVLQKVGFAISNKLQLDFFGNYDVIKNTFDSTYGGSEISADDALNNSESKQYRLGFLPKYKYSKGEFNLNTSFTTIERTINQFNSWTNTIDVYNYASRNINVDAINKHHFSKNFYSLLGVQYQYFDMSQLDEYTNIEKENAKFNIVDPYATLVYNSDFGLNINAGARMNNHTIYGSQWVYNINPSYNFKNIPLKALASYSTAYITPSLYQLFSPYGNLDLKPEENATVEGGFEVAFYDKKIILNTVGFYREETNSFGFYTNPETFASNYINIEGTNNAKGIETSIVLNPIEKATITANYTFTQVEEPLSRLIPKHKANINLNYSFCPKTDISASYQYIDDRKDAYFDALSFSTENVSLKSYQLVNASISHKLIKNRLHLFCAITNILNTDFEENIGFSTRGRNFKIGLNVMF